MSILTLMAFGGVSVEMHLPRPPRLRIRKIILRME